MIRIFRQSAYLWIIVVAILLGMSSLSPVSAQDLSRMKVDEMSDAQVRQFMQQVQATGMSNAQLEQIAAARGMSMEEIQKLRQRVDRLDGKSASSNGNTGNSNGQQGRMDPLNNSASQGRTPTGTSVSASGTSIPSGNSNLQSGMPQQYPMISDYELFRPLMPKIFGHELFYNAQPQFVPNLRLPTPRNYVIGPGDQLQIDIYGDSEVSHQLVVSPEGSINVPYVGLITVGGMSMEAATSKIKNELASRAYSGIRNGRTQVSITLGEIRSIQVILAGEVVQPGTYTLPSVATVFNALYAAGGPNEHGSVRQVRVFRDNALLVELDVYDFLLEGALENNITLRDQDIVQVGTADHRVSIRGEVRRPIQFDLKPGDSFSDLLRYAGGFTEQAYTGMVHVERVTARERRVEDLQEANFSNFLAQSGDQFVVGQILDRYENRVQIHGAVYNPGTYELTTGLSLSMLIRKADGIREDAYTNLGYIDRKKENLESERINFNVAEVLAGTQTDIQLRREDEVFISSIFDLKDAYTVQIQGEVRHPGTYPYAEGMQIEDLIMQAGGLRESASLSRIELSRRIVSSDPLDQSARVAEIFQLDLDTDLHRLNEEITLQPFDFIAVRSNAGYEVQRNVRIEGEVLYPGIYTITSKSERISDLIERSGGLTQYAYAKGGSLRRGQESRKEVVASSQPQSESDRFREQMEERSETERLQEISGLLLDSTTTQSVDRSLEQSLQNEYVGIRIDRIVQNENVRDNILLEDGDVIYIPKLLQTVRINGEVLSPVNTVYRENMGFRQYVSNAGGFTAQAHRKKAYIIYANGSARSTKSFLGMKFYPTVEPGSEIFVPQRPYRERLTPQAWVGLGTGVASLAAIIVSLLR